MGLTNRVFVPVPGGEKEWTLGIAERGTRGYFTMLDPVGFDFDTYDEAAERADSMNKVLGFTPDEAAEIIGSTMRRHRALMPSDRTRPTPSRRGGE